jgi:hypothetical protein
MECCAQFGDELCGRRITGGCLLRESALEDRVEPGRKLRLELPDGWYGRRCVPRRLGSCGLRFEGASAGEQFERHDRKAVTVARRCRSLAAGLLRREIASRPEDRARLGQVVQPDGARDPEIADVDVVLAIEQEVSRLDVAMNYLSA